ILECIQANQIFPKKSPVLEEENMQVPFPELHGEFTEYVGRAEDAIIAMSNYRLHIKFKESVVNVPLQLIESVECRDMFQLHVTCKDCKIVRCQFTTFEQCQEWLKRLTVVVRPPARLEDLFSFAFHAWCMEFYAGEKEQHGELCRPGEHVTSWFKNEVERMGFDTQNAWRISDINSKFRLCPSYPQQLLVPAWITDKELENVAGFRSWKRFPAVVYRHLSTGAVIARCGQPEVSWWGWRNADDEHLVQSIAKAWPWTAPPGNTSPTEATATAPSSATQTLSLAIQPHKLLILDARSYAAAVANRAKGGGCECPEYYPNCEVVFMGMANIHSIRKSFQSLRFLCTQMPDPANWLSALESTKWLQHLSLLLKASLLVVNAVDRDQRPVLVHCSDGWDRTPQIVALSKLLLDPYYRTIEGFQVLVETEWLDFGHKFADRCGHGENSEDLNERCPVFLQWLDCVHQLQRQFPCSFEFNERSWSVKLVQHSYSCLFGTFLCNSGKEREDRHVQERTCSVWSLLRPANRTLRNMLYSSHSETVLHPVCHVRNLMLWTAVYLPSSSPTTPSDDSCAPYPVPGSNQEEAPLGRRTKTRSFDNLPSARSSDPSLNDKWQDHRRSLELMAVGPEGGAGPEQEVLPNGVGPYPDSERDDSPQPHPEPGLSQDKEDEQAELSVAVSEGQMENILQEATKEEAGSEPAVSQPREKEVTSETLEEAQPVVTNGHLPQNGLSSGEEEDEESATSGAQEEPRKTVLNGFSNGTSEEEHSPSSDTEGAVEQDKRGSLMESSTETLTEEANGRLEPVRPAECPAPEGNRVTQGEHRHRRVCSTPLGQREGERAPLSRQVSVASCSSLTLLARGVPHRCCHMAAGRVAGSPEQPSRSHLDDDGLTLHTDAIQQRLRQIEAGHQLEVETLKKQVQELWSRLENQQHMGLHRTNGELGDELTSMTDSEFNLDPNCLSRCSTEVFSEASWEQVDRQDTEVTRWYPDHLAAQCYGCENRFWLCALTDASLVSCRNCGNVFCASCCDQKIPVPSQQLFEPTRVCKTCFSNLQLGPVPRELDLDKPIAASSN
uniref:phosphatidylinositol-3,5-bisphosphate 3-phosphatase n=1 Tax=Neogobius melanostomus TaxID=47308 RepID=A0A8C6UZ28_9GOBI